MEPLPGHPEAEPAADFREKIDLIYTANYQNYAVYAAKGAFNPLDELVPAVSPALQEYVTEEMWDATRVGGSIYMVPCMWPEYVPYGFLWRKTCGRNTTCQKST